jgi:hypothetical protein
VAILTGRYGTIKYDAAGVTPVAIISLNTWKASFKQDYEDVTCFQDENKVYVPGMPDVSGSLGGFWNSEDTTIFAATKATVPGLLELAPNSTEPDFNWSGLAYLDADIDCSAKGAPKITSTFKAGGNWTMATDTTPLATRGGTRESRAEARRAA